MLDWNQLWYLAELTCSNGTLLQFMFRVTGRLWLLNKIVLVLDRFNVSLFFLLQPIEYTVYFDISFFLQFVRIGIINK